MFSLPRKFGRKSMEDNSPFMIGHDNSNHNIPGEAITPTELSEDEEEDDTESIIDKNSNVISSKRSWEVRIRRFASIFQQRAR